MSTTFFTYFFFIYLHLYSVSYINDVALPYLGFKASYAINDINPVKELAANLSSIAVFHA